MYRGFLFVMLLSVIFAAITPSNADAQKKKVPIAKTWSGSVDDEKAIKPEVVTSAKQLEIVWKAWGVKDEMPKIDFKTDMVVAVYSEGSKLNIAGASLDDNGNLTVLGFGTRDLRPGFRYVLGVVSRDGVKTVNKKPLPQD